MKIHFVTSEALPFSKTGGLADVVYGLSKSFVKLKHNTTVITPLYGSIDKKKFKKLASIPVVMNWRNLVADLYEVNLDGIRYIFIANDYYFNRATLYGFDDETERFAFFSLAYIQLIKRLNLIPDIVHVHDWETAMIPLLLKLENYQIKTVLTIHNPAFQGSSYPGAICDYFNIPFKYFENGTCRFHDYFSSLKTGIVTCDLLTTVSKTHAIELLEDLEDYNGIGHVIKLRKDDFIGIANGVDDKEFDPLNDEYIEYHYDKTSVFSQKLAAKKALVKELNLSDDGPVFGIISRLTEQKGLDFLPSIIEVIKKKNGKLLVLGSGQKEYEKLMFELAKKYPETVYYYCGYSNLLAHKIYSSSDFLLMPSRYEPCGISQLVAKRYGTLPIVSNVGGLVDTVIPFVSMDDVNKADGFRFDIKDLKSMTRCINAAIKVYNKKTVMQQMIINAMEYKSDWIDIAPTYIDCYQKLMRVE